jgi:hypothetical protein
MSWRKVKEYCIVCVFVGVGITSKGTEFDPFAGPKPIAILFHLDPSHEIDGGGNPRVAIYENGLCIVSTQKHERMLFRYLMLDKEALEEAKERTRKFLRIPALKPSYRLTSWTDQKEARFYGCIGQVENCTFVYGLDETQSRPKASGGFVPDQVPAELLQFHQWLLRLDYSKAQEWLPDFIEVLLSPTVKNFKPDGYTVPWPSKWPKLDSERAKKRGYYHTIYLDSDCLPEVQHLLDLGEQAAVFQIQGQTWQWSMKYVFPGEPAWEKEFSRRAQ